MRRLAVLIVVLAGCGVVVPSQTPSGVATHAPTPTESPTAPASLAPPSAPTPARTTSTGVTDLSVELHRVESELTNHIEAFVSLGDEIVWSGGSDPRANELYRYVPDAAGPELLYLNLDRDSSLTSISGGAAGYVFTDERWVGSELRGWNLWYLAAAEAEPVLLDQSISGDLIAPTIAMDDHWIAWEVVHGRGEERSNELKVASVNEPLSPTTLLSFTGQDAYLEFPSLWGDELWYGIADTDWVANTEKPRVEMIDLSEPAEPPVAFGADQRAFMPAAGRDIVAWKSGRSDGLAALNSGAPTLYWRATQKVEELPVPAPGGTAERISYPSVGNRFVAWWDDDRARLFVYDLVERQFRRIVEYEMASDEIVARPSLSANLLAWLHYSSDGEHDLEWAVLPE